jgi:serine protease inhibitor
MKKTGRHTWLTGILCLLLAGSLLLGTAGCTSVKAADLMDGITAHPVTGKIADKTFASGVADFSTKLFTSVAQDGKNTVLSPLSVMLALAMTANGADGQTLAQMEQVLGNMPIDSLNAYLLSYINGLPSEEKSKLHIANSIWFRDDERLQVNRDFLQKNADFYHASVYKSAFDKTTVSDINSWVSTNTDGLVENILDDISADAVLYLINAMAFDAEWQNIYESYDVSEKTFTALNGDEQPVDMMHSEEHTYLEDDRATGFLKPYKNGRYSFMALLPKEGINFREYVASLTGERFLNLLKNQSNETVVTAIPKFRTEYSIDFADTLKKLGMPDAFSGAADFSKMARSSDGDLFISRVLHKAYIEVDERGTKAGAATVVEMKDTAALYEPKSVILDRPFVYAILDGETGLPIFLGTTTEIAP